MDLLNEVINEGDVGREREGEQTGEVGTKLAEGSIVSLLLFYDVSTIFSILRAGMILCPNPASKASSNGSLVIQTILQACR